jgi:DNA-binding transcriptional LysR family regulator
VADPELLRSLVAWGYGYTLANARPEPERAVDGAPIRALPLRGGPPPPRVGLARRAGLEPTRTATAFAEACTGLLGTRWGRT